MLYPAPNRRFISKVISAAKQVKIHIATNSKELLRNPALPDVIGSASIPAPKVVPATISVAPMNLLFDGA